MEKRLHWASVVRGPPSLNTQSCIKGLLVVRDFRLWAVWAAGPALEKKLGQLWATFEGGFFMFSRAKKMLTFLKTIVASTLKSYIT